MKKPFSGQSAPSQNSCPQCGSVLTPGMPFCPSCGKKIGGSVTGPICPSCGTTQALGNKFCAACGEDLSGAPAAESVGTAAFDAPRVTIGGQIVVLDEAGNVTEQHPMNKGEITIGRGDADVAFPDDPFLSPLHAKITAQGDQFRVRDLGSRNGTWYFVEEAHRLEDGDLFLVGSQVIRYKRLGYPGPNPPERDATRRMGSLIPSADIASLTQLRSDGSDRDTLHLSPGRNITIGREHGDWIFPYDPSMSGTHAQIQSEDADFVVVDAGSRNGVAVAVRGDLTVGPGARILVGDKMLRIQDS